jgi:hypothetical protein
MDNTSVTWKINKKYINKRNNECDFFNL